MNQKGIVTVESGLLGVLIAVAAIFGYETAGLFSHDTFTVVGYAHFEAGGGTSETTTWFPPAPPGGNNNNNATPSP